MTHPSQRSVSSLSDILAWFEHNAGVHLAAPHGLEQYSGAAWGVRDACQGPFEWLLARGETDAAADILADVFTHQYADRGDWPQWYMHAPFQHIQSPHAHGDVAVWPLLATAQYLRHTGDFAFLDRELPFTADAPPFAFTDDAAPVRDHLDRAIKRLKSQFIPGTHLLAFGDGDWNDSLQPAQPRMRENMVSTWTVMLFYQALRQLAEALDHQGDIDRGHAHEIHRLADRIIAETNERLVADGETAGLYLHHDDLNQATHLLHPRDRDTGIHHRLLPMIRGIISGLFTPQQATHHLTLIREHLLAPDGARLFDTPPRYRGGTMLHFQRAESAAFFGREVGLMYTHAHLRYAQALATLGHAEDFYHALLVINPVGLRHAVSNALPRQANVYFSSSDADFANRAQAEARYDDLMQGNVPVHGGWRLYSSGPGLFLSLITQHLLGIRHAFNHLILDPLLPAHLHGLTATTQLLGQPTTVHYTYPGASPLPGAATLNGHPLIPPASSANIPREPNPYRPGGLRIPHATVRAHLRPNDNVLELTV